MTTVGSASIDLTADVSGLTSAMNAAMGDLSRVARSMEDVGRELSLKITAPIVGLGIGVVKAAADFDLAMTGVAKTVDAPASKIEELGRAFQRMSERTGTSANEIAAVGEAAGQLGVPVENLEKFTEVMVALGVSTNLSATEAATTLARFANVVGTNLEDVDRLGSVIVGLGNNFATTEAEIAHLGQRLAAAGKQVGLTEGDILGFAAALSSVGINAEAGGTAFSKVMIELASDVANSSPRLEQWASTAGMSVDQFTRAFREDAAGAIVSFIQGLGNLDSASGETFLLLEEMGLTEIRLRNALLSASSASDTLSEAVRMGNEAWAENVALSDEAELFYGALTNQFGSIRNMVVNLAADIGTSLRPQIDAVIELARGFIERLRSMAEWFIALPGPMKTTAIAIAGIAAAVGPLLLGLGALGTLVSVVGSGLAVVSGAFAAAAIPIAAVTAAVAAGILVWSLWGEEVVAIVQTAWSWVIDIFQGAAETIAPIVDGIRGLFAGLQSAVSLALDIAGASFSAFADLVRNIAALIVAVVSGPLAVVWDVLSTAVGVAVGSASTILRGLGDTVSFVVDVIRTTLLVARQYWDDFARGASEKVDQVRGKASELVRAFTDMTAPIRNAFTAIGNTIAGWASQVVGFFQRVYTGVREWLVRRFAETIDAFGKLLEGLLGFLDRILPGVTERFATQWARVRGIMVEETEAGAEEMVAVLEYTDQQVQTVTEEMATGVAGTLGGMAIDMGEITAVGGAAAVAAFSEASTEIQATAKVTRSKMSEELAAMADAAEEEMARARDSATIFGEIEGRLSRVLGIETGAVKNILNRFGVEAPDLVKDAVNRIGLEWGDIVAVFQRPMGEWRQTVAEWGAFWGDMVDIFKTVWSGVSWLLDKVTGAFQSAQMAPTPILGVPGGMTGGRPPGVGAGTPIVTPGNYVGRDTMSSGPFYDFLDVSEAGFNFLIGIGLRTEKLLGEILGKVAGLDANMGADYGIQLRQMAAQEAVLAWIEGLESNATMIPAAQEFQHGGGVTNLSVQVDARGAADPEAVGVAVVTAIDREMGSLQAATRRRYGLVTG